jgi:cyclopropane fatty-acyl-phospholipid synthase-like methyltransferase
VHVSGVGRGASVSLTALFSKNGQYVNCEKALIRPIISPVIASNTQISAADVARHYDELDAFYRDIWGEHVHHGFWLRGDESQALAVRQLVALVASEAHIGAGTRVVDIGCGYGATARLLAEERGANVNGITISPAQHALAVERSLGRENPRFFLGDWLSNELRDDTFDAAIAIESSEHMADKPRFFAQAHRVLRDGGRFVICAWLACEQPTAKQERWLIEPICREGQMPHLGSASDYRRLAEAAGFKIERVQDVTRGIARTWPLVLRTSLLNLAHKPAYVRFLFNRHARNRIFALTIVRLWLAFRSGAMRYGVFTLVKASRL